MLESLKSRPITMLPDAITFEGRILYLTVDPALVRICHCTDCQMLTGSPVRANAGCEFLRDPGYMTLSNCRMLRFRYLSTPWIWPSFVIGAPPGAKSASRRKPTRY